MKNNPSITIVILTYKRPKLLKRAIRSDLNQTYPYFKVCVYDDASGDETGEIVAEMQKNDARIFYYCNKQNLGFAGNCYQAWEQVNTPYYTNLGDDDIFLPTHLETVMKSFREYPEAMFSANQAISITDEKQIHKVTLYENCNEGLHNPPEGLIFLLKTDPSILQGAVYRSEVIQKVGYYDVEVGQISDWDYVFRIAAQFSYVINKVPGYIFYVNKEGFSGSKIDHFFWPQWLKMSEKIVGLSHLSLATKIEVESLLKGRLRTMLKTQGKEACLSGNFSISEKSAQILYDYFRSPRHYLKLNLLRFMCRWFPPFKWCAGLYNEIRTRKKFLQKMNRYREYQHYTSFLQDSDT